MSAILDRLADSGSVAVTELAAEFGVSLATLRRDLQLMEEQKLLGRTHGGAVARDAAHELPVRYRTQQREQKRAIARVAVTRDHDALVREVVPSYRGANFPSAFWIRRTAVTTTPSTEGLPSPTGR